MPPVVPTDTLPAATVTVPPAASGAGAFEAATVVAPAVPVVSVASVARGVAVALALTCPSTVVAPATLIATEPPCDDPLAAMLPVELTVNVWAATVTVPPMAGVGPVGEGVAPAVTLPSTTTAPAA